MRGVAGKDHPAVHEFLQAAALEGIDRHPVEPEAAVAEHALQARQHVLGTPLQVGIGAGPELEVDTADVVGLLVEQRRAPVMEGRVEPEPAFGGQVGVELDVGDQEALLEALAGEIEAEQPAQGRAGAIAGDHPFGIEAVRAVRRLDRQGGALRVRRDACDAVPPAQLDQAGEFGGALGEVRLDIMLLEIDESRHPMTGLGQQVEAPQLFVAVVKTPDLPGDALVQHARADAQAVEDLQAALRPADRATALFRRIMCRR